MTETLALLDRLIAFPTVSAASNLDLITFVRAFLAERGFAVTLIPDATGLKAGLYAELGPSGAGVLLSAHTDVVPVTGQDWTRDPFRLTRDGDRLYGRGTTDMKGFIASVLALADRAAHAPLRAPFKIVLSYDEEIGCTGLRDMLGVLTPLIGQPRACIVGEPTEMQVAIGHKGKAALRAICTGQSGHSALAPQFVNALHLATDFVLALRALQDDLAWRGAQDAAYAVPYSTVHAGMMTGGTALNIVPNAATVDLEYRYLPADAETLAARIADAAQGVAAPYRAMFAGAQIAITEVNHYPGLAVAEDADVVTLLKRLSGNNGVAKVPFGTEAGYFAQLGIPTAVCGPGSMAGQGHQPDEYITLEALQECDRMMDRLLEDLTAHQA